MSAPLAHVTLKDAFLYYSRRRVFLLGGESFPLERNERALLDCIHRGESELGVLANSLAHLELGGDPRRMAQDLLATCSDATSLLEILAPRELIEPEVIVCSFTREHIDFSPRRLVLQLRRRYRVLHLGVEKHVSGDPRSNLAVADQPANGFTSSFQFLQWARSIVRFYTRAVLVLTGVQDRIFFADMAATHHSLACVGTEWPTATGLGDMLGGEELPFDPAERLQALLYAMRMTPPRDYPRILPGSTSELAALDAYAIRHAEEVAYVSKEQLEDLEGVGRSRDACRPLLLARGEVPKPPASTGVLALVMDMSSFQQAASILGPLQAASEAAGYTDMVIRASEGWFGLEIDEGARAVKFGTGPPVPEAAIFLPGVSHSLRPILNLLGVGTPTVCYPTNEDHPLLEGADESWTSRARTTAEWTRVLSNLRDPSSAEARTSRQEVARIFRSCNLMRRVRRLVDVSTSRFPDGDTLQTRNRKQSLGQQEPERT